MQSSASALVPGFPKYQFHSLFSTVQNSKQTHKPADCPLPAAFAHARAQVQASAFPSSQAPLRHRLLSRSAGNQLQSNNGAGSSAAAQPQSSFKGRKANESVGGRAKSRENQKRTACEGTFECVSHSNTLAKVCEKCDFRSKRGRKAGKSCNLHPKSLSRLPVFYIQLPFDLYEVEIYGSNRLLKSQLPTFASSTAPKLSSKDIQGLEAVQSRPYLGSQGREGKSLRGKTAQNPGKRYRGVGSQRTAESRCYGHGGRRETVKVAHYTWIGP